MATPISVITRSSFAFRGGIGVGIALHVKGLFRRFSEQCAGAPFIGQKVGERAADALPERGRVGFEDHELGALVDRLAQVIEIAPRADVTVFAVGIAAHGARTPDPECANQWPDKVHADIVQAFLVFLAQRVFHTGDAAQGFVRRCLEHTALRITACIHASDIPARRDINQTIAFIFSRD